MKYSDILRSLSWWY